MLIPFTRPLDLENTLEVGQAFRWRREPSEPTEHPWFWGVAFDNLVKLRRTEEGVEFFCAPDSEAALSPLLQDYLRLGDDLSAIYESIRGDERVSACIDRYPGLRLLRQDPWECLVSFICSANNNIRRIGGNVEDMSRSFGRPVGIEDRHRHTFPTPEELADAGEHRLRELGLGFRAKYVAAAARRVAGGEVDLYSLREAPYEEALNALVSLEGVADKVANCVLLFSLDKLEAFPVDVWIDRALRDWYPQVTEKRLPRKALRPWAQERFGPYAGYANQYLFHQRRSDQRGKRAAGR